METEIQHIHNIITPISQEQKIALSSFWKGQLDWNVDMANYSTFRSGGKAAALIRVNNDNDLHGLLKWLKANNIKWRIIGGGSNILVSDPGFSGIIIHLKGDFEKINNTSPTQNESKQNHLVYAGAGCTIAKLLSWSLIRSLSGLEFLTGIPGSIGGAVQMNAGAWKKSICDILYSVTFSDWQGNSHVVKTADINFSYRSMILNKDWSENCVITGAIFILHQGDKTLMTQACRDISKRRKEKQPVNQPSAGSFFKNPIGDSAGRLIEAAGLKGLQKGKAMVSHKHANFIINTGHATAGDIKDLMKEVQQKVYTFSGIKLEPEVHFL